MDHLDIPQFLGLLVLLLAAAELLGGLAQPIGQPAVLGELVAGVLVGASVLGLVNVQDAQDPRPIPGAAKRARGRRRRR